MRKRIALIALITAVAFSLPAVAQRGGNGSGGRRNGGGAFQSADQTTDPGSSVDLQVQLRATTEEWKVIGPLVDKLASATQTMEAAASGQDSAGGRRRGVGANDTFNGPGDTARGTRGGTPASVALDAFSNLLFAPSATAPSNAPPGTDVKSTGAAATNAPATNAADDIDSNVSAKTITLAQAMSDLQEALADPAVTNGALRDRLETVRAARSKARGELEDLRTRLRRVLTTDQESMLVALGYME